MPTRTWATAPAAVAVPPIVPVTYVVAAVDSQDPTRADALYRCDGVADEVTINAALAALPAGGGCVKLLEGTYTVAGSITITVSNVSLIGCGANTLIQGAIAVTYITVAAGLSGVRIEDLRIDGTSQTAGQGIHFVGAVGEEITDSIVRGCYVSNCFARGIYFAYTDFSQIISNWVRVNGSNGIDLWRSDYNLVVGNYVYDSTVDGIKVEGGSVYNVVSDNVVTANDAHGIIVTEADNNLVSGNQVYLNGTDGILLYSAHYTTVVGNEILNNGGGADNGLRLNASDYCIIIGNHISLHTGTGLNISNAACNLTYVGSNYLRANGTTIVDSGTGTRLPEIRVDSIFDDSDANVTLGSIGDHVALSMADAVASTIRFNFRVPSDFQAMVRARLVVVPAASGNLRRAVATDWGACDEVYNADSDAIAESTVAGLTINQLECLDLDAAFTGIVAGDHVGVAFTRNAVDAEDTIEDVVYVLQFWMQYV